MKKFIFTISAFFFLSIAAAVTSAEATYEGSTVSYEALKSSGKVIINLDLENPSQYEQIKIVRSDNPVKYFRQVKLINASQIGELTGSDVLVDNFPLPGSQNSFYKVVTIAKNGVQKTYPTVKVSKY